MGHGQGAKMKDSGITYQIKIQLVHSEHHISARIAVEGEITVSVCKGMYQCQGRMHFVVHQQIFRADTKLLQRFFQCFSKLIISYFSNKGSFLPKVI